MEINGALKGNGCDGAMRLFVSREKCYEKSLLIEFSLRDIDKKKY